MIHSQVLIPVPLPLTLTLTVDAHLAQLKVQALRPRASLERITPWCSPVLTEKSPSLPPSGPSPPSWGSELVWVRASVGERKRGIPTGPVVCTGPGLGDV